MSGKSRGVFRYTEAMADISLERQVRISDDAVFRELDGEAVILQLESGMYFGLDTVGTRLWQLLAAHGALRPAYDAALREFEVAPDVLERDLLQLVSQLADKNLVVVSG
jgi:hypothetical protein